MINEVYICFENKLSSKLAPLTESDKKIVNSSSDFENFKNNGKSFKNVRSVDKYIFYQIENKNCCKCFCRSSFFHDKDTKTSKLKNELTPKVRFSVSNFWGVVQRNSSP